MKTRLAIIFCLVYLVWSHQCYGQNCSTPGTLNEYVFCRIQVRLASDLRNLDPSKQIEEPSVATNSTTLADKSAGPDVIAASVNPSGLSSKSRIPNTTDASVTATLYGIYSAWREKEPFNPAFYRASMPWRRLSISIAPSYPENASQAKQSVSYGAKFQIDHLRDPLDPSNKTAFEAVSGPLRDVGVYARDYQMVEQKLRDEYQNHPCPSAVAAGISQNLRGDGSEGAFIATMENDKIFPHFMECITSADISYIDSHTSDTFAALSALDSQVSTLLKRVQGAPQIALSFLSKIGQGTGSNLYRSEVIMERGVWKFDSTTNASYDFSNSKTSKPNKDTFRFVEDFEIPATSPRNPLQPPPLTIGVSGEGDWGSKQTPTYKAQGKVKLTLISGLDIPIAITYSNQTSASKNADLKGVAGFAIDFAKLGAKRK
jgi:hypothetical protein